MTRARGGGWTVFAASAVCVVAALAWISHTVLRLETDAALARHEKDHGDAVHLALWRMDAWVAARLAPEAARPADQYVPESAGRSVASGRLSPLVNFRSPLIRLHFQIEPDGSITSPQARDATQRPRADLPESFFVENRGVLAELEGRVGDRGLGDRIAALETSLDADAGADVETVGGLNRKMQQQRVQQLAPMRAGAQNSGPAYFSADPHAEVGQLVPLWLGAPGQTLVFARRVRSDTGASVQGFVVDWEALAAGLRETIVDDFPNARVEPVAESRVTDDTTGLVLASVPAALVVELPPAPPNEALSWTRAAVLVAWLASLAALGSAALTVRASLAHAERRDRFAAAVTHELRTPLTSFRMVADLLADDMVPDPARRKEHVETLRGEAERLSGVVENVLAYSQVERGGGPVRPVATDIDGLVERLRPALVRRADRDGVSLSFEVEGDGSTRVTTDPDVLQRIAQNLVDNACKYGAAGGGAVAVLLAAHGGRLVLEVADDGPGVPARLAAAIFEPFDRGAHTADGATPGVGLGLPLSRALARRLGGDLVLIPSPSGARFRLTC